MANENPVPCGMFHSGNRLGIDGGWVVGWSRTVSLCLHSRAAWSVILTKPALPPSP